MSDEKPREWWIVDGREGYRVFGDEHEAIIYAGRLAEDDPTFTFHVVEYSALSAKQTIIDTLTRERDKLREKVERDIGSSAFDQTVKERDEARADAGKLLRGLANDYITYAEHDSILTAARAQVGVLTAALERIGDNLGRNPGCDYCARIAREALRATEGGADSMHKSGKQE